MWNIHEESVEQAFNGNHKYFNMNIRKTWAFVSPGLLLMWILLLQWIYMLWNAMMLPFHFHINSHLHLPNRNYFLFFSALFAQSVDVSGVLVVAVIKEFVHKSDHNLFFRIQGNKNQKNLKKINSFLHFWKVIYKWTQNWDSLYIV